MIGKIALVMALLAAPQQTVQDDYATAPEQAVAATQPETAAAQEQVDFLGHILDARYIYSPFGKIYLPEAGSWMLGPLDITPTRHVVFLWLAALIVLTMLIWGGQRAKRHRHEGKRMGRRYNAVEALVLFFRDQVVMPNVGHGGERFAPFVITLFFFIVVSNLLGLLPWGATSTANISVTAGLAILAFVVIEYAGVRELGLGGYMGTIFHRPHGMHPAAAWTVALLLAPVEFAGKFTKPFALAVRLMANMTAGHLVLLALLSLVFVFGSWALVAFPIVMATAIFFLEIFVAFLQAYIFAILTAVFIGLIRHSH